MPPGVSKANWEYVQAAYISTGYEEFLDGDPLTVVDRQILARYLPDVRTTGNFTGDLQRPIVADIGCGTVQRWADENRWFVAFRSAK